MTVALVTIGDETTTIEILDPTNSEGDADRGDDHAGGPSNYEIPRGMASLHRNHITADPPHAEDLTNAIGDMADHLDDALRELPTLGSATTVFVAGTAAEAIAAVEVGGEITTPTFDLSRAAAEDVFRTLATEPLDQRRRNPGLPASLVGTIAAGCCALVAVLRSLHLDNVTIRVGSAGGVGLPSATGSAGTAGTTGTSNTRNLTNTTSSTPTSPTRSQRS